MNYNPLDVKPKELISESLEGVLDPLEEQLENFIILGSLVFSKEEIFTGSLLAVEFGDNPKIDIKAMVKKSFEFIGSNLLTKRKVHSLVLSMGEEIIQIPGPFSISNLKIVETDYENKTCVLAIDLFKEQP